MVHSVLDEQQVYRIDHFLGKEATQDLHMLRFANGLFDAMWNREHVESVQIDVPEKLGITDRSVFYDATGAVLDMLVTHLFQVAAEVAMEPPASLGALDLQAAREKVIKSFRPLDPAEVVLGQFTGYRDVPGVAAKSSQNTFVAARLWIDNPRWRGVPFYLRTGKRLAETKQRVSLILREPPGPLAGQLPGEANVLSFSPGRRRRDRPVPGGQEARSRSRPGPWRRVSLPLSSLAGADPLPPYVRLIHDVLIGDRSLFTRPDGLAAAWKAVAPLLANPPQVASYAPGSWGPAAGPQAHRAGPLAAGAVCSEAELRGQGGVIPEHALGPDPGAVEADDGDGQHLGPPEGRLGPGQQPGQLAVVGERHRRLVHQPPPVNRPGDPAQLPDRQAGTGEPGRRRSARRPDVRSRRSWPGCALRRVRRPARRGPRRDRGAGAGLAGAVSQTCSRSRMNLAMLVVTDTGLPSIPNASWFPPCLTLTHPR